MSSSADLEKIYDAITAKKLKAWAECDVDGCAEMYADHAVFVNKHLKTCAYGIDEIKKAIKSYLELGPYNEFKFPRKEIYGMGPNRFYVNADCISSTQKMTMEVTFEQLFEKINGEWKCVFEA